MAVIDFISGWSETVDDGSPIWDRAAEASARGAQVHKHAWSNKSAELLADFADVIMSRPGHVPGVSIDFLIIVVGVNNVPDFGQDWKACWFIPPTVKRVICFNTVYRNALPGRLPVLPECCPIRNPSDVYVNENLFYQGVDHVNVMNFTEVVEAIEDMTQQLLKEEAAGAVGRRGAVVYSYGCAAFFNALAKAEQQGDAS
jgi:hypothetical protein